ncbi:hypothetical protein RB195_021790 [Necator americanus]|uniref:Uncharacterized protein n=1 Tax=Necator americanus TaxID=51031 RepID=A0ABR1EFA9_NECAM
MSMSVIAFPRNFDLFMDVLAYPSLDDARQDVDVAYLDSWQDTPFFQGPYQKRWANQVRFGKRASSWASSVRFG